MKPGGDKRRVMFVVPPLTGHVNPTVAVAAALQTRGHEVAWVAHPGAVGPLLPAGARLFGLDDAVPEALQEEMVARARATRGLGAFRFLWEDFLLPLARAMVPGVEEAVQSWQPDVLVVDQQALAGAIVARRRGQLWASFATTSAGVSDPLAGLPQVKRWLDQQLAALLVEHGLAPVPEPDRSPHALIVFSTEELTGPLPGRNLHLVGPALRPSRGGGDFPFHRLDPQRPRILVSLGTVNAERGARFFQAASRAIQELGAQGIFTARPELLGPTPPDFIVQPWVPMLELLPQVSLLIGHGGHNSSCEALACGRPLLLAPIRDDQPVVAEQIVRAGAGLRVRFGRVEAPEIAACLRRLLDEPSFSASAAFIASRFRAAGGAEAAAGILEELQAASS